MDDETTKEVLEELVEEMEQQAIERVLREMEVVKQLRRIPKIRQEVELELRLVERLEELLVDELVYQQMSESLRKLCWLEGQLAEIRGVLARLGMIH